jgi:hypothetical protein
MIGLWKKHKPIIIYLEASLTSHVISKADSESQPAAKPSGGIDEV